MHYINSGIVESILLMRSKIMKASDDRALPRVCERPMMVGGTLALKTIDWWLLGSSHPDTRRPLPTPRSHGMRSQLQVGYSA
jgi:hypothetical protein